MSEQDIKHAPAFLADDRGVVVLERGPDADRIVTAAELRARADAADLLERVSKGWTFLTATGVEDAIAPELDTAKAWVVDAPDHPDVARSNPDAWIWKVDGAPGRLFLSSQPPPADPRIVPACARDFPRAAAVGKLEKNDRVVRLLKGPTLEKQTVLGIVLEPETTDSQGDIYSAEEIESAAHNYMEQYQTVGHMHQTALPETAVRVAESYLAPVDFEVDGQPVKAGTWLMVVHVLSDALWAQIKAGDLTGFSIGGFAQRVPVQ